MTREIKFRAWDKKIGEEDYKVLSIDFKNRTAVCEHVEYGISRPISLDDLILEQFTGLKDIAGTDIYENDLVIMYQEDNMYGQVVYNPETGILMIKDNLYHEYHYMDEVANYIKVTGNIHQNKDLLER